MHHMSICQYRVYIYITIYVSMSLCHYQLHVYMSLCLSSSWIPLSLVVQFRCPSLGLSSVWKGPGIDSPSWWSYTMPLKVQREVVKFMAGLVGLDGPDFRWTRGNSTHPETKALSAKAYCQSSVYTQVRLQEFLPFPFQEFGTSFQVWMQYRTLLSRSNRFF